MRVLMLSWEYPPVVVGGLGRHVYALSQHLAAQGHEVVVLCRQECATDAATQLRAFFNRLSPASVETQSVPSSSNRRSLTRPGPSPSEAVYDARTFPSER